MDKDKRGGRTCDDLDAILVLLYEAAHRQPEAVLLPVLRMVNMKQSALTPCIQR